MTRAIKFRGFNRKDNKWFYGNLSQFDGGDCAINDIAVDPDTVGQFTGLLDKNDREIYAGDILLLTTTGLREHCFVEWNSEVAGWCISLKVAGKWKLGVRTLGAWMNEADFRIQGNRFDNPELLNEK